MEYLLSDHHRIKKEEFRLFAEKELDCDCSYPLSNLKKAGERGYMGLHVPTEWNGAGEDFLTYTFFIEEVSRICPSTGVILSVHSSVGTNPVLNYGTDEQKKKFMPGLASGELIAAFALTEAEAGSDAASLASTATKVEGGYLVNGTKVFITSGGIADIYIVFATVSRELGSKGITAFIVEKDWDGLSYGNPERKMGLNRSCTTELVMDNLFIPDANLLGIEKEGFSIAKSVLSGGRIGIAAQGLGLAQACIDRVVKIISNQGSSDSDLREACGFIMANLATELEAARLVVYYAALLKENGVKCSKESSMAKVLATDTAVKIADRCIDVASFYNAKGDEKLNSLFCDAKVLQIYEGTNQVQRIVISRELLSAES